MDSYGLVLKPGKIIYSQILIMKHIDYNGSPNLNLRECP